MITKRVLLCFFLTGISAAIHAGEPEPGSWARYLMLSSVESATPPVEYVTLRILEGDQELETADFLWEMVLEKHDGESFAIQILSNWVPLTEQNTPQPVVNRYRLLDRQGEALEFRDALSGGPFLPPFEFIRNFLPTSVRKPRWVHGFDVTGNLLGHTLSLEETGEGARTAFPQSVRVLSLNTDYLMGTSRQGRDDGSGTDDEGNYTFSPFSTEDYRLLIDLGWNLFRATDDTLHHLLHEPVFFVKSPGKLAIEQYPEIFYRSNYFGMIMFHDEPALRLVVDFNDLTRIRNPEAAAQFLRNRIREKYHDAAHRGRERIDLAYRQAGCNLGNITIRQREIPIWEAQTTTAFYEMQAGADGVIKEGFFSRERFEKKYTPVLGGTIRYSTEEMLLLHYAWLRGAARCMDREWGMSIYGLADPAISAQAVTMAYDAGAKYLWFWSSGGGFHTPWSEQVRVTRALRKHIEENYLRPRARKHLIRQAEVGIVLPEGTMAWNLRGMWYNERFNWDTANRSGVQNRDVIATAMWEALKLAREGVGFDFVIESDEARDAGYEELLVVGEDATVTRIPGKLREEEQ